MRHRAHILGAFLLLSAAAMGFACSLNPQPFPPAAANGDSDAGVSDDAFAASPDGSGGSDARASPDASTKLDGGTDGGTDADTDGGTDADTDGGDAETPSDAALAEGG